MSTDKNLETSVNLPFADGVYKFALPLPRMDELEKKTGRGIGALFARIMAGRFDVENDTVYLAGQAEFSSGDLIETVRQGLIGGGQATVDEAEIKVSSVLADRLIQNYLVHQPLTDAWKLAAAILGARIEGRAPDGNS